MLERLWLFVCGGGGGVWVRVWWVLRVDGGGGAQCTQNLGAANNHV